MTEPSTPLPPIEVLTLAALGDRPRYGYELVERIEGLTDGRVRIRPGNLYRVLHRLEVRGWVEEVPPPPGAAGEDERRQYLRATPMGMRAAREQLDMYARVRGLIPEPGHGEA